MFLSSIRFWAALGVLAAFFFLPFLLTSYGTMGVSRQAMINGWELASDGQLLNYFLCLVPASAVYVVLGELKLIQWQQDVARMILLIVAVYFFLHYGFLRKGGEMSQLGLGMWVMMLGSVVVFFQDDVKRVMGRSSREEDA